MYPSYKFCCVDGRNIEKNTLGTILFVLTSEMLYIKIVGRMNLSVSLERFIEERFSMSHIVVSWIQDKS